ncbi:MAG: hypothetical protein AAB493_00810 [Patescibacteria group bacterium]
MLPEQFGYLIILSTVIGYYFYFKNMFFGETRPNLVSWFIWMLAPFIGVFFQLKAGAGLSVLPVFIAGFGPLIVLVASLIVKNGYWKITKFDMFCGFLSLIALAIYILTKNLGVSILFAILSDGLAAFPTIIKSWKFPHTETGILYLSGIVNNIIGLLIIKNWIFSIYSFGVYFIIINLIIVFCIYRKKIFKKLIYP